MKSSLVSLSLILLASSTLVHADTILVDKNGGPGSDYTDVQSAVDAAQAGDVIFIRAGLYSSATITSKRLTLIADPGTASSNVTVLATTPSQPVVIVGLDGNKDVLSSTGMVLIDRTTAGRADIGSGADVRIQGVSATGLGDFDQCSYNKEAALRAAGTSRVEAVRCTFRGGDGWPVFVGYCGGGNGSDGALVLQSARFHATMSTFIGGDGGDDGGSDDKQAGYGGNGLYTLGSEAPRLVEPDLFLQGGQGGLDDFGTQPGGLAIAGTPPIQDPLDPALEVLGSAQFGQPTTWRAWAAPGAQVDLLLGTRPQVLDDGVAAVELLVKPLRMFAVGTIPASGFVDFTLPPVPQLGIGSIVIGQAHVDLGGGDVRRSNSAVAVMVTPVP